MEGRRNALEHPCPLLSRTRLPEAGRNNSHGSCSLIGVRTAVVALLDLAQGFRGVGFTLREGCAHRMEALLNLAQDPVEGLAGQLVLAQHALRRESRAQVRLQQHAFSIV